MPTHIAIPPRGRQQTRVIERTKRFWTASYSTASIFELDTGVHKPLWRSQNVLKMGMLKVLSNRDCDCCLTALPSYAWVMLNYVLHTNAGLLIVNLDLRISNFSVWKPLYCRECSRIRDGHQYALVAGGRDWAARRCEIWRRAMIANAEYDFAAVVNRWEAPVREAKSSLKTASERQGNST